jgi:hypothetical protein
LIADTIHKIASGEQVRRLTLFDDLEKSPESGASRQLITNSSRYGLTTGSYSAEYIELTPEGRTATAPDTAPRERLRARFKLAIENIEPFRLLYDAYNGKKLPTQPVMYDLLREHGLDTDELAEAVDTFVGNAKFIGLLKPISGAERLLTLDHALDDLGAGARDATLPEQHHPVQSGASAVEVRSKDDWASICFYVTPIGDDDSEHRMHSDLFLESIVAPALEEFGLSIVRADQIGKPGMITAQVIEHVANAKLVVADLSFHNPNVFYEIALRHAKRLPIVQIIRAVDRIPFDLDQFRTIRIDTSTIYTLVPQLATYKSEIANQVRRALEDDADVDNPLTVFYPRFFEESSMRKTPAIPNM